MGIEDLKLCPDPCKAHGISPCQECFFNNPVFEKGAVLGDRTPLGVTYTSLKPTIGKPDRIRSAHELNDSGPQTYSVWGAVIEDVFNITGRGLVLSSTLLYGKPKRGDVINIAKNGWLGVVEGLEVHCIGDGLWVGANVGFLLSKKLEKWRGGRKEIVITTHEKEFFQRGLFIMGGPVPEDRPDYARRMEELRLPRQADKPAG